MPNVARALRALVPYMLRALRALIHHVLRALRAFVRHVRYVLLYLTCLLLFILHLFQMFQA